ncbi:hypothetical protein [Winogradskyella sp.]|nr:hypothetical protein [Winogradskyella sp.]
MKLLQLFGKQKLKHAVLSKKNSKLKLELLKRRVRPKRYVEDGEASLFI